MIDVTLHVSPCRCGSPVYIIHGVLEYRVGCGIAFFALVKIPTVIREHLGVSNLIVGVDTYVGVWRVKQCLRAFGVPFDVDVRVVALVAFEIRNVYNVIPRCACVGLFPPNHARFSKFNDYAVTPKSAPLYCDSCHFFN